MKNAVKTWLAAAAAACVLGGASQASAGMTMVVTSSGNVSWGYLSYYSPDLYALVVPFIGEVCWGYSSNGTNYDGYFDCYYYQDASNYLEKDGSGNWYWYYS